MLVNKFVSTLCVANGDYWSIWSVVVKLLFIYSAISLGKRNDERILGGRRCDESSVIGYNGEKLNLAEWEILIA